MRCNRQLPDTSQPTYNSGDGWQSQVSPPPVLPIAAAPAPRAAHAVAWEPVRRRLSRHRGRNAASESRLALRTKRITLPRAVRKLSGISLPAAAGATRYSLAPSGTLGLICADRFIRPHPRVSPNKDRLRSMTSHSQPKNGSSSTTPEPERPLPPAALRREQAAAYCGLPLRTWDRAVASGLAPQPIRVGRIPLWRVADLDEWLAAGAPPASQMNNN